MNRTLLLAIICWLLAAPVMASNDTILLNPDDLSSKAIIDITGDHNRLVIEQLAPSGSIGNSIVVAIAGNGNGGPAGSRFRGVAAINGLSPGQLIQSGFGNSARIEVTGDNNLFAIAQNGNNNTVVGKITGLANQASIYQAGNRNYASFSQDGIGNSISVRQVAW